jgi:1-acyl-sn-glycerol-3-phosphate acyltransferase
MKAAISEIDIDRDFSPRVFRMTGAVLRAFTRVWFRSRVEDLDRIPREPVIVVGNHSGVGIADVMCLLGGWFDHFGDRRRAVGLMHDLFVGAPLLGRLFRSFGAVRASRENAAATTKLPHDIVVYPGGDIDACRPMTRPRDVDFGSRRGYIRLALQSRRPIVPVATLGSHHTYLLLPLDGLWRAIRLRKFTRLERLPVPLASIGLVATLAACLAGALPASWVIAAALWLLIPNPTRVTSRVLEPIDVSARTEHITDPEERVEAAHALVHGALSAELKTMQHRERA